MANHETLHFRNQAGITLSGLATYPDSPRGWVLAAHCFTCNKNYKFIGYASKVLNAWGYGVFRFDFTGLGESGGNFADTNLSTNIEDVKQAAAFMVERFGGPQLLIGHSLGAAAVISAAPHIPSTRCVAAVAASFDPRRLARVFRLQAEEMAREPEKPVAVTVSGRNVHFKKQFLDDLERHADMEQRIRNLNLPLLVLHSSADAVTPVENGERIFAAARQPKSFVSLEPADHLLSSRADANYAAEVIAGWADRYIPPNEE
jgi:alpha-beta hydrolase superfamily lysophospholipase